MSGAHDGHRLFFPVGNPFRAIFPKGSHLSPRLNALFASNEEALALILRKLKPDDISEVFTLSWMRLAMDCLSELHADVGTLITDLELPVSDWDDKWVDIYFNSSLKLLDICIALSSELARLDQGQLLVKYVLHVLDPESDSLTSEQLKRVKAPLNEWMERVGMKCPSLENCSTTLQELAGNLCLMKVKHSAKGKLLMRALYGIEAVTVFICSVLVSILLGSSKPLVKLHVPEKFGWSQAFNNLQAAISEELRRHLSRGTTVAVKELEVVEACVRRLHGLASTTQSEEENAQLAYGFNHEKEVVMSDGIADQEVKNEDNLKIVDGTCLKNEVIMSESLIGSVPEDDLKKDDGTGISNGVTMLEIISNRGGQHSSLKQANSISHENEVIVPKRPNGLKGRAELLDCISDMSKSADELRVGLDSLSKRVGDFFQIVLTGRDALLCNFRIPDASKVAEVRS